MNKSFGPKWVEKTMKPLRQLGITGTHANRIYEAVARCETEVQARVLVNAVIGIRRQSFERLDWYAAVQKARGFLYACQGEEAPETDAPLQDLIDVAKEVRNQVLDA